MRIHLYIRFSFTNFYLSQNFAQHLLHYASNFHCRNTVSYIFIFILCNISLDLNILLGLLQAQTSSNLTAFPFACYKLPMPFSFVNFRNLNFNLLWLFVISPFFLFCFSLRTPRNLSTLEFSSSYWIELSCLFRSLPLYFLVPQ